MYRPNINKIRVQDRGGYKSLKNNIFHNQCLLEIYNLKSILEGQEKQIITDFASDKEISFSDSATYSSEEVHTINRELLNVCQKAKFILGSL